MSETTSNLMLADTGRATSRLGYGCSSLMGALGERESLRLLDAAFDAGIRHFDVAPLYGFGAAEGCLGSFLRRHPGAVTVTTKYGVPPAQNQSLLGLARRLAGPVVQRIPALKQRLQRAASAVAGTPERASFSATEARESMERSLRALGVERIDVWLLHEVEAADLVDESLLRFLEDAVAQGKIGTFGVGSDGHKVDTLLRERPEYCRVVQHEWSVMNPVASSNAGPFRIHHRALTNHFQALHAGLVGDVLLGRRWADETGANVQDREVLANVMLKAALVLNPASVILVSSKNAAHIAANMRVMQDDALTDPARRLYALVQAEGLPGARTEKAVAA